MIIKKPQLLQIIKEEVQKIITEKSFQINTKRHLGNTRARSLTIYADIEYSEEEREIPARKLISRLTKQNMKYLSKLSGSIVAFKKSHDSRNDEYYAVDLDSPIYRCVVGSIKTEKYIMKGSYSPKTAFNISGDVRIAHLSELDNEYRGKGIGSALYDVVWNDSDAFVSDTTLFKGSFAMWTKHILPNAAFFGLILGGTFETNTDEWFSDISRPKFIIPLKSEQAGNTKFLSKKFETGGFIAIKSKSAIPEPVKKISNHLKGIDVTTQLTVVTAKTSINGKIKTDKDEKIIDYIESLDLLSKLNFDELNASNFTIRAKPANVQVVIILFNDATLVCKEGVDGLNIDLI